jgi:hypothetical protein
MPVRRSPKEQHRSALRSEGKQQGKSFSKGIFSRNWSNAERGSMASPPERADAGAASTLCAPTSTPPPLAAAATIRGHHAVDPICIRASYIIYATPRLISWGDRHRRLRAGRHHWDPTAQCASRRPTTTPAQRGGASQPLDGDKQQRQRTMGRSSKGCSCRRSSMVWGSLSTSEEPTCGYGWHRHTIAHTAAHV